MTVADLWQLGLVLVLILVNAAFAGSEMALISLRESQVARLEERSRGARVLAGLLRDPNRFLATIQIGITLAGFLASATASVSLAEPVADVIGGPLGDAAEPVAIVLVTLVLTFFTLVLGELAPKRLAMQHAEGWALFVARPISALATISRPAVWLLSASTDIAVRLLGGDPAKQRTDVSEEELRDMILAQPTLTSDERQLISGALDLGERKVRDALVPRTLVFALPASCPVETAIQQIVESGHTRLPVYGEHFDDMVGIVHLKRILGRTGSLGDYVAKAPEFPESLPVLDALRRLQQARQQMALVVDEYGGIAGIVTIEDLVEEIVGEIYDEYDRDVMSVTWDGPDTVTLPGSFPVHDLPDLGLPLAEGRFTTIAGLILERLGHLPEPGESVDLDGWSIAAVDIDARKIIRVRATRSLRSSA